MTMIAIEGNTYPVREQLRGLGGVWSSARKVWMVPAEKEAEARSLVGSKSKAVRQSRTCKTCGCRINYGVYCGKCEFS